MSVFDRIISLDIPGKIDQTISFISPKYALQRQFFRERLTMTKRSETYAAAKSSRLTGTWLPADTSPNPIIAASSPTVRARVRQLVRDFPVLSNAVDRLCDYTVGPGIQFQSKVKDRSGNLDKRRIQQIEDAAKWWMDEADVACKLHYYEMMAAAQRQESECGEYIIIKRWRPNEDRYLPYCLQLYEPDWLTAQNDTTNTTGIRIWQGIEYDTSTGRVIAYHFLDPDTWGKPTRIPASDVIHGFKTNRPGQLRGISPFAAGLLLAHSLSEYMEAEIDGAKLAAKWLAFVKSPTPAARQLGLELDDDNEHYLDELENGIIEYLNPGEEIELASSNRPGSSFTPMVRLLMTMFTINSTLPYEILSGDYSGVNYTTMRVSRNDFLTRLRPKWAHHIRHFCKPTITPFFDAAVLTGRLSLPNYFTNPKLYQRADWQPPGIDSVDPLRESKAQTDGINTRIRSPQETIRMRGRDPEDVLMEIKEWQTWMESYGINTPDKVSKNQSNNPASIVGQK